MKNDMDAHLARAGEKQEFGSSRKKRWFGLEWAVSDSHFTGDCHIIKPNGQVTMKNRVLTAMVTLAFLAACSPNLPTASPTIPPASPTPIPTQIPTSTIPPLPSVTPVPHLETADLTAFAAAWNSHDAVAVRAFYAPDARYFPEQELWNLEQEQPIDVLVWGGTFAQRVQARAGLKMRMLGQPLQVFDKLVAFIFRWENDSSGYNGAALLRYEDSKIYLHTELVSAQPTPNQPDASTSSADEGALSSLMQAWNAGDPQAAASLYLNNAALFSDEDLVQAPWRDFTQPPKINYVVAQFKGWDPAVLGQPLRLEDTLVFAWHWKKYDYPTGYGIRLVHYSGGVIDIDVRFAIRPWETDGGLFLNP